MAMDHTANVPYYEGVEAYKRLGYVPFDQSGTAASTTLEYAYDDWTIYRTALLAGDDQLADLYKKRANNYRNVSTLRLVLPVPVIATESSGRNLMQCRLTGKDL